MAKKKVTVVKSPKLQVNTVKKKPSERSKCLGKFILDTFNENEKHSQVKPISNSKVLTELIANIFSGNTVDIKDHYATLVTYLIVHSKDITYDVFSGIYEAVKMNTESSNICYSLPYGALISSGVILKWEPEQQNQIVSKMLKISQNDPGTSDIIFHYLIALDSKVKLQTHKLKKISISSPRELYFMLSVDSKQEMSEILITSKDINNLIEVFFKDGDLNLRKKLSDLFAKKLLSFESSTLYKIWGKIENHEVTNLSHKVLLLSSIFENCKDKNIEINRFFTASIIKALSTSNQVKPEYSPIFKSLQTSLTNIVPNLPFNIKFETLNAIILNCKSYINKLMIVKLSFILVRSMKFEEINKVADLYKDVILNKKNKIDPKKLNKEFNDDEKNFVVKQLAQLVSSVFCKHKIDWRYDQMIFLFELGFLNEFKDIVHSCVQSTARKCFFDCLNHKWSSLKDLNSVLSKLIKFASKKIADKDEILVVQFRDDAHNLWFKTISVIKGLKENDETIVFRILLQYIMLCMFSNYINSRNTLEELFKVIENKELEGDIHWTEVMIDLFLQLLSNDDAPHRSIVNSTFSHICKFMTNKGLDLILSVIKGENKDNESDNEEGESADENSESDNDDVESDEDANESDESGSETENEEENEGQIDRLKGALRQELFKIDTASTCGSVDLDDLDEEEGRQLNSTLGEIFKLQHNKFKSSNKNKVDNLEVQFRIRVIELLETFIDSKPSLYFCTVINTSLLTALKLSIPNHTLAPFSVRVKKCLKRLTDIKEFRDVDCVTETSICSLLNQIIDKDCPINVYQDMTEQIIDSFIFLVHASSQLNEKSNEVYEFINNLIIDFKDNDHLPLQLLSEIFIKLSLKELITLASNVIKFSFSKKLKYFKRSQYLQLLITFYSNNRIFQDKDHHKDSLFKLEETIINKILKCIKKSEKHNEFNNKYCCMIFDLLSLMKLKNILVNDTPGDHWNSINDIIELFSKMPSVVKQLKISFANFCKIFNNVDNNDSENKNQVKKKKRKSTEDSDIDVKSPKIKKKKKNKVHT